MLKTYSHEFRIGQSTMHRWGSGFRLRRSVLPSMKMICPPVISCRAVLGRPEGGDDRFEAVTEVVTIQSLMFWGIGNVTISRNDTIRNR